MEKQRVTLALQVLKPREFTKELRKNAKWLRNLAYVVIVYVIVSSILFYFADEKSWWESFVFTVLNISAGFGRINAATHAGDVIAMCNSIFGVLWFGMFIAILGHSLAPSEATGGFDLPTSNLPPSDPAPTHEPLESGKGVEVTPPTKGEVSRVKQDASEQSKHEEEIKALANRLATFLYASNGDLPLHHHIKIRLDFPGSKQRRIWVDVHEY